MRKSRKKAARQENSSLVRELILAAKGALIAVIITMVFIIVFAVIMQTAGLKETIIRPVMQVARILSIALGGIYAARTGSAKGWLKGAVTGFCYVILVSLIGVVSGGHFAFDGIFLSDLLTGLAVGAIGGVIGINLK